MSTDRIKFCDKHDSYIYLSDIKLARLEQIVDTNHKCIILSYK